MARKRIRKYWLLCRSHDGKLDQVEYLVVAEAEDGQELFSATRDRDAATVWRTSTMAYFAAQRYFIATLDQGPVWVTTTKAPPKIPGVREPDENMYKGTY